MLGSQLEDCFGRNKCGLEMGMFGYQVVECLGRMRRCGLAGNVWFSGGRMFRKDWEV